MSNFDYFRNHYGVPAGRGKRVEFEGQPGVITSTKGPYLRIRLDGEKRPRSYHPLWHIDYLDGVDYQARFDRRAQAFTRALNTPQAAEPLEGKAQSS